MRAREFLKEETTLPPEQADPMNHVFVLPGVSSSDPYQIYRLGVAIARARSDARTDGITSKLPAWSAQAAFGEDAVIAGFNANVAPAIDHALKMAYKAVGSHHEDLNHGDLRSQEHPAVNTTSPVTAFRGYPR